MLARRGMARTITSAVLGLTIGLAVIITGAVTADSTAQGRAQAHDLRASGGTVDGSPTTTISYRVGRISEVSIGCPGTGDVAEAVDRTRGYVYQAFEGCDGGNGIGFARSTDRGRSYGRPVALPGSRGGWDPWLAVAPDGTLYAAFMNVENGSTYPIIDVSHDHGRSFVVKRSLRPARRHNWGDADYLAVGSTGTLYVAWGYGPSNRKVKQACDPNGSCWASRGDINVVVQSSADDAKTFSPMAIVTPGYPDAGADEGAIAISPNGTLDVLYQDYKVTNRRTLKLAHGHEYFTSSSDGGKTWTRPVLVGASAGQITINEWWNDGSIASDTAGNLYATWDTQATRDGHHTDTGWLSFSTDGGQEWSTPVQAPRTRANAPHIMEVTGAGSGEAYVGWLSSGDARGWAMYLRTFSIGAKDHLGGWLSGVVRVSRRYGDPGVFPGDTFGIATLALSHLLLSWGSAVSGAPKKASVFAASVFVRAEKRGASRDAAHHQRHKLATGALHPPRHQRVRRASKSSAPVDEPAAP